MGPANHLDCAKRSYNERLFSGGIRKRLHEARFHWLQHETRGLSGSVLELGCFDCRSLSYLSFQPTDYLGIDANWEGGLDSARRRYPKLKFVEANEPSAIAGKFDCAIALETMYHVPRLKLPEYLAALARAAPLALFSVQVEIGPVFACKQVVRPDSHYRYTLREYLCSTLGLTQFVEQHDLKGFNYLWFIRQLAPFYRVDRVWGLPRGVPPILAFGVGIRCRSKVFERDRLAPELRPAPR